MYTETQLSAIKIFGRKDLSFGCLMKVDGNDEIVRYDSQYIGYSPDEILGHIPHWHDLFLALRDRGLESFLGSESLLIDPDEKMGKKKNIEVNKYIPLLDQPSLPEIINLFK